MPDRSLDKLLTRNQDRAEAGTKAFERSLARVYRDAYNGIEAQIAALYAKMGEPPSLAEARRYNRLQAVQDAVAAEYKALTKRSIGGTRDNSAEVFAEAAYGTEWAYDQAVGIALKWPVIPVDAIRASVWTSINAENFADRYRTLGTAGATQVNKVIASGLAQGLSYPKMARNIRDTMNMDYGRAIRIVRTESNRNYTEGHLQVYDSLPDMGIQARKQWVATLDTRTRDTHGTLDGAFANDDGLFEIRGLTTEGPGLFGDPAEDINCRCRVIEVIDDLAPELRRIRGEGIVEYKTFADWAGAKGWNPKTGWDLASKAKIAEEQARKY